KLSHTAIVGSLVTQQNQANKWGSYIFARFLPEIDIL
ncbi:MAG: hypothetical protein ACJAXT_001161, partial [Paracoccaceae bacterium]